MKALVVAAQLLAAAAVAHAAGSVTLTGSIGSRAILIVNGNPPKTIAVGESYQGVKLVSLQAEQAVVELDGKRVNLRMDTPVSIGGGGGTGGGGSRVVLSADSRGHFMTQGAINGRPVTFMLDTGATSIALSADDALRIGLDYSKGQRVVMNTANGQAQGYRLDQLFQYLDTPGSLGAYVEHKDVFGLTVRASVDNLLDTNESFGRSFYNGLRTNGLLFTENRDRFYGPIFSLTISGTI